ncbi:hypothetical protein STEG23_027052 [Scotinomys teguina]
MLWKYKVRSGVVTRPGRREKVVYMEKAIFGNGNVKNKEDLKASEHANQDTGRKDRGKIEKASLNGDMNIVIPFKTSNMNYTTVENVKIIEFYSALKTSIACKLTRNSTNDATEEKAEDKGEYKL